MAYITVDELKQKITEAELVQLADDAGTGLLDAAALVNVQAAIDEACSDIDAYAGSRYTVPLATSTKLKELARTLARWHLEERRSQIREATQRGYEAAMKFLRDLSMGTAVLDQPTGAPAQTGSQEVLATEKEDVFSEDNLDGY